LPSPSRTPTIKANITPIRSFVAITGSESKIFGNSQARC
jgi:hypothetical protein